MMASILRSGKFVRYFAGFTRSFILNTQREAEGNAIQQCPSLVAGFSHGFATVVPKSDQNLERSLKKIDHDVRRSGRISRRDIEEVLEDIRQQRSATSSQSLLVIRCCGNLVPEELPEVRTAMVQEIWRTLNNLKVPMDISHYNALLRVYLENEHSFKPTEFLAELEAKGVEPNRVTYQRLIFRYCQLGDIEGATKILEFMREKQLPINEHVFNALIMGHAKADDMESAKGILSVMKQAGLEPSADTYTILLCSFAKNGDIASIEATLNDCEKSDIILLDKDILDVVYELSINGHTDKIDPILARIRKMVGYNQDAVNLILRLTNKGQTDGAFKILKTMTRNARADGELIDTGNFFIKQMIKAKIPTEKVLAVCKELEDAKMNSHALLIAIEASITSGLVDMSIPLLKELQKSGQPMRQHYFWPLLCAESKNGTDNVLDVLRQMQNTFNITPNGETVRDYVVPNLKEGNMDKVISLIRSTGISTASAVTSTIYHLLSRERLKEAADIASSYNLYYQPGLFRRPLINALVKTNDFDSYILFVRKLYESIPRSEQFERHANEDEFEENDGEDINAQSQQEILGQLVFDALIHFRQNRTVAVTNILDGLVHQGLSISNLQATRIQEKLGSELTDEISMLLGKLAGGELEPIPMEKAGSRSTGFAQMSPEQLERTIEMCEAKGENTNGLKRLLLSACFKTKDLTKTEELLAKLEKENFVLSTGIYAQLIDLYCYHENVEKALEICANIREKEPDFLLDDLKTIKLTSLLIAAGRFDEAISVLELNKKIEPPGDERSFNYLNICWRLLNSLAEAGKVDELKKVFDVLQQNRYIEPTNVLLGPLVKVHIINKNLDQAVDTFEEISTKYNCTPWKNDLCCKLIQAEDAIKLQRVTDLSTTIHGEVNSLYDLVFAFVECGRVRQARKILETPGLRSRSQRINSACERYRHEGLVEPLEGLIEATKDLNHIDRAEIFYNLLLSYKTDNQVEKALGLWTKMQEENITPSDEFLHTLGTFLESENVTVPFAIPKGSKREKTSQQIVRNKVEQRTKTENIQLKHGKTIEIENLLKEDRLTEATKKLFEMLRENTFPLARVFRFYLNKLAASGDFQTMRQIEMEISNDTKKLVSFDNRYCQSYINSGKSDEFLTILEKRLDNAKSEQDFICVGESFPKGGAIGLLENNPNLLDKFTKIAEKYAAHNMIAPMNIVWINLFLNGRSDEADTIWQKYLSHNPRIMFQKILLDAREKKDDTLVLKLIELLRNAKIPESALGVAYSCLLDVYTGKGEFDKALTTVEQGVKDVCLENFNRTALERVKAGIETAGKKFPYQLPRKTGRNLKEDTSSSSSSSSSSDDEPSQKK